MQNKSTVSSIVPSYRAAQTECGSAALVLIAAGLVLVAPLEAMSDTKGASAELLAE